MHWRSTARVGELMVRREEQPFTSRGTLLLDARLAAHGGQGPGSSLEWAVSAVASIGVALLRSSYALRLLGDTGLELVPPSTLTLGTLLGALADVTASPRATLDGAIEQLRRGGVDGVLIAVLGDLTPDEAQQLARLRHGASACIAVLLDTHSWGRPVGASTFTATSLLLRRAGWRVLEITHGTTLASVWPGAGTKAGRAVVPGLPA